MFKRYKTGCFCFFIVIITTTLKAQNYQIDSLIQRAKIQSRIAIDSSLFHTYYEIAEKTEKVDKDTAIHYLRLCADIAKASNYTIGIKKAFLKLNSLINPNFYNNEKAYIQKPITEFIYYSLEAELKLLEGDCQGAFLSINKSKKKWSDVLSTMTKINYYLRLAKINTCLGDHEAASLAMFNASNYSTSIYLSTKKEDVIRLQAEYQTQIKLDSIKILNLQTANHEEILLRKKIFLLLTGLWGIILGIAVCIYRKYFTTQKHLNTILEQAEQQKSKLFTNITHKIKTPLTVIEGIASQGLKSKTLEKLNREQFQLITKSSQQLLQFSNHIFDLTKFQESILTSNAKFFYLHELIAYILPEFQWLAQEKQINLILNNQLKEHLIIYSDVEKISTILQNLLDNAIKHTPKKGKIIIVIQKNNAFFQFSITDNGAGILKEDLPYIFDRYYQSNSSEPQGGIGIGLAICKDYIDLLDGNMKVKSIIKKGSTFLVNIPINHQEEIPLNTSIFKFPTTIFNEKEISTSAPIKEAFSILIVEDNADFRQYLKMLLQENYDIIFTNNGDQAITYLEEHIPSLIITDWMMPIIDGLKLVQYLKNKEQYISIPVLMLTARSLAVDQLKALRIGVDNYLVKPFDEAELLTTLTHLLDFAQSRKKEEVNRILPNLDADSFSQLATNYTTTNINLSKFTKKEQDWLLALNELILQQIPDFNLALEQIATPLDLGIKQLSRKIKAFTGLTAKRYIQEIRFWEARRILECKEEESVKAVCYSVGFKDVSHFSRNFRARFGKYPREYFQ